MVNFIYVSGLLLVFFLIADAFGLVGNHYVFNHPFWSPVYQVASGLGATLALMIAAWCLKRGLQAPPEASRRRAFALALSVALILCVAAVTFRHAVLVTATSRAPEDHFPLIILLIGFAAGLALALTSRGIVRRAGFAYMILAPLAVLVPFILGLQVDFQAITERRAERLGQAIERYQLERGQYPSELEALTPGYLLWITGPLTGRGQVWCYQADTNGYRLGYAFFQRYYDWEDGTPFYEPYYDIITPVSGGQPLHGGWQCDQELELLKKHGGL